MDVQFYPVWDLKCGKVAFYTGVQWWSGANDRMDADHVIYPDGSEPRAGDIMRCGFCGRVLAIKHLTNVKPAVTFQGLL